MANKLSHNTMQTIGMFTYSFFIHWNTVPYRYPPPFKPPFNKDILLVLQYLPCYLSLWNFVIQYSFFSVAFFAITSDLLDVSQIVKKRLEYVRVVVFHSAVVPFGVTTFFFFWTLYAFDRELIYPESLDQFIPAWINHTLHTLIMVPIILEFILPKKRHYLPAEIPSIITFALSIIYVGMVFTVHYYQGVWIYPFLNGMHPIVHYVFATLFIMGTTGIAQLGAHAQYMRSASRSRRR